MSVNSIGKIKKYSKWTAVLCGSIVDVIFMVAVLLDKLTIINLPIDDWFWIDIAVGFLNVVPAFLYMIFNMKYDNLKKGDKF